MGLFRSSKRKKRDIPQGMWIKCTECEELLFNKDLDKNFRVCPHCEHHFPLRAVDRVKLLIDEDSFVEIDASLQSLDPLEFQGPKSYLDKISQDQKRSGLNDAIICGIGKMNQQPVAIAVMDFFFMAGSMGSVVGERITRLIEQATEKKMALIIVCASGGARMQESILSLMQMAKTSAALSYYKKAGLLYISILTNPTTGGTTASFASLGDMIFAEPKALIGFAGPRVIKQTINQDLPEGFQQSEFLFKHGLIDNIIPRNKLKAHLSFIVDIFYNNRLNNADHPSVQSMDSESSVLEPESDSNNRQS